MFAPRPNHPYAHAPRFPEGDVELSTILPGDGPFEIEIGPGRGGFTLERLAARPDIRMLGLEIRLKWSFAVDEKVRKAGFGTRGRVLNADAKEALTRLSPDASVSVFYLHFPDPWWKARHEKRLVMGQPLLDSIARLLVNGGELFVQTDVYDRALDYEREIGKRTELVPAGDEPGLPWLAENPYEARSPRERHAIEDGLPIQRLRYRRATR